VIELRVKDKDVFLMRAMLIEFGFSDTKSQILSDVELYNKQDKVKNCYLRSKIFYAKNRVYVT